MTIIPMRDLKDTAAVERKCQAEQGPIFVTKNGYGDMVIMSMKAYEEKMYLLDVYAKLAKAEDEIREGKTTDARESLKELRARHGL